MGIRKIRFLYRDSCCTKMLRIRHSVALLGCILATTPAFSQSPCDGLGALKLPSTSIAASQSVPATAELPASCRVSATLRPSADSEIRMEVWLPSADRWNGNFLANGNGGCTGFINPTALSTGLRRGYATVMCDLGHQGGSANFAMGHPEKLIDFGYRASHEMTVAGKAIATSYYGRAPKLAYWTGCSAGGRQAMMEAQRYPADFDGIVAGAPGLDWTGRALLAVWIAQAMHKDEAGYILPSKYALIHNAVLRACDALDGVKDGVLESPSQCKFDPQVLLCRGADGLDCLTEAQVKTARTIYAGPVNPRTNLAIAPGLECGSELGWATMGGPQPLSLGTELFKYVVFQNPDWDYRSFDFDKDVAQTLMAEAGILNARNPDLSAFFKRGGKLIQYHGWSDPQIPPRSSVIYYQSVLDAMGGRAKVQNSYRLFMVPGMAHCSGGDGTSTFDMLSALEQWVTSGKAPEMIPASRRSGDVIDRTRPLCPYPQVARYKGAGDVNDAACFVCGVELRGSK